MRFALFPLLVLIANLCFSQRNDDSIYFPQEQIIHPKCANAADKNDCFYELINSKVTEVVNANAEKIKTKKDTLKVNIELTVDINGNILHDINLFKIKNKRLGKKSIKEILRFVDKLPQTKVFNKKPEFYASKHLFNFEYTINRSAQQPVFNSIGIEKKYDGGVIEEIPVFPGCEGLIGKASRTCFQTKIQKHIKDNFRYPETAIRNGISGKVYLIMTIDKEGTVKNIRTKGPDPVLEEEGRRIMSLLPKMKPSLVNGKPTKIPYSIPITFRL